MAAVTRLGPARASSSTRPNQAVVNLDAVRLNTRTVLRSVQPAAVLAAVKADAYPAPPSIWASACEARFRAPTRGQEGSLTADVVITATATAMRVAAAGG